MNLLAELDLTSIVVTAIISMPATIAAIFAALTAYQASQKVTATQADVKKIEVATNSMKDALVLATGDAKFLEGEKAGRATEEIRQGREDAPQPNVQPVIDGIAEAVVTQLGAASDKNKKDPVKERVPVTLPPPEKKEASE